MKRLLPALLIVMMYGSLYPEIKFPDSKFELNDNSFIIPNFNEYKIKKCAVLPVKISVPWLNKPESESQRIGYENRSAEKIELMLMRLGYDCIERREIDKIIKQQKFELTGLTEAEGQKIGKLLSVDLVVMTIIPDFGYWPLSKQSTIEIITKGVHVATGKIVWKGILTGKVEHGDEYPSMVAVGEIETKLYKMLEEKLKVK